MDKVIYLLIIIFQLNALTGQNEIVFPDHLEKTFSPAQVNALKHSVDSLVLNIESGAFNDDVLLQESRELLKSTFDWFLTYRLRKDKDQAGKLSIQVTNMHELSPDRYAIGIAYLLNENDTLSLMYDLNLIAVYADGSFKFAMPLQEKTRFWKNKQIGKVRYFYRESINLNRAEKFSKQNNEFADEFGIESDSLEFYLTGNYQEFLNLLGINFSIHEAGKIRDGYGVDDRTIFAIQGNEDFSHDIFHYYSGKVNKREDRNWITEEGIAYLWGNAYYVDENHEMIGMDTLVSVLKAYLESSSDESVFKLFSDNSKIFDAIAPEISVRSLISGLLAKEVESKYGMAGLQKMINCGRKDQMQNYMSIIHELLGISKENFDNRLSELIENF